jgi:hypothetical protein
VIDQASRTQPTVWNSTRHTSARYEAPALLLREIVEPGRAVTGAPDLELGIDDRMGARCGSWSGPPEPGPVCPSRGWRSSVLAVSELAGNTVRHAGGGGRLALWTTSEGIVCEVTHRGGDLHDPLVGLVPPKPSASAGMGVWIARQLSDSFAIGAGDDGTTVRSAVDR